MIKNTETKQKNKIKFKYTIKRNEGKAFSNLLILLFIYLLKQNKKKFKNTIERNEMKIRSNQMIDIEQPTNGNF